MKILNISLDQNILDENSVVALRVREYGELVDKYDVVVCANKDVKIKLSDKVNVFGIRGKNKIVKLLNCYSSAEKILNKEKYDVITVQDQYYFGILGLKLARKFSIGLEIQVHGFEKYFGLRKIISKKVIKSANSIRVVSQRLKNQLVKDFGIREEKITVAPIYSDPRSKIQDLRIKGEGGKFVFLTVGRLVKVKKIEMQIRAISEVVKKYSNIELWIVGDGPLRKKLEVETHNYAFIRFLGWQDDLDYLYKKADVFLLTSDSEGWGLAAIEAASFGLPIIMTDVGCAGEVIKNEESGLVIPVGDQGSLEDAMVRLIIDEDFRIKIGKGALEAIKKLPPKEEIFQKYLESWNKAKLTKD